MVLGGTKMNIGFYVNTVGATEQNGEIFNALGDAIDNDEITDASVFYNDIDYNPIKPKFGLFNATELWAFTGVLIATTLENVMRASKVVNKFKLLYLHDNQEKNLFMLLDIANKTTIIVRNQKDSNEIYRLTGKNPKIVPELAIKKILEVA